MTQADNATISCALSPSDINITINGEPRVLDLRLAEVFVGLRSEDRYPKTDRTPQRSVGTSRRGFPHRAENQFGILRHRGAKYR